MEVSANVMATRGGTVVDLDSPSPFDFQPEPIARTLSYMPRYAGNHGNYSVAQHAVLVAYVCDQLAGGVGRRFAGLHHDDAEAITGDIPTPVKRVCHDVGRLDRRLNLALNQRYSIDVYDRLVKQADQVVFCNEVRVLVPPADRRVYLEFSGIGDLPDIKLTREQVMPWPADVAFSRYMDLHEQLSCARGDVVAISAQTKVGGVQ